MLAQNRFENSKAYYEAHKQLINELAVLPMRQIAQALAPQMEKLDPLMQLIPTRMVSRIRRDTRFTKDKSLYRENLWITFARPKASFPNAPCFWFEITQQMYTYGLGIYHTTPAMMQAYRDHMRGAPDQYRAALQKARHAGFSPWSTQQYKREKEGDIPADLKPYYNLKDLSLCKQGAQFEKLASDAILQELGKGYRALEDMYRFYLDISARVPGDSHEHLA